MLGRVEPGKRAVVKFAENYLDHLRVKAEKHDRPARWAVNVKYLGALLLPEWGRWPLADPSHNRALVAEWHKLVTRKHGPIQANRCGQVSRATYEHAMSFNRNLPPALPTSRIIFNRETSR